MQGSGNKPISGEDLFAAQPERLAELITNKHMRWVSMRTPLMYKWQEVQEYVFATDTSTTSGAALPWSNNVHIPKLCQIRDTLEANYMKALFPPRPWIVWEGESHDDEVKSPDIENYLNWSTQRNSFRREANKLVLDYIDTGNVFVEPIYRTGSDGFTGPALRRISPFDITFDPTVERFEDTPKIVRTLVSMGEAFRIVKEGSPSSEDAAKLISYMETNRRNFASHPAGTEIHFKDHHYLMEGFSSYRSYLESETVEILTFYGDIFDAEKGELRTSRVIKVIDGNYIISDTEAPCRIHHVGWRHRHDNLYGMGPLENLVGMQFRVDHLENLRADVFDTFAFPPMKIKGEVPEFNWGPFEKIWIGDNGDITPMWPQMSHMYDVDQQIAIIINKMEEMAGAPKEAAGFRTPGEKTAYEVKRLETAASRIFNNKIEKFERDLVEPLVNDMLTLSLENMSTANIRTFNKDLKVAVFKAVTKSDLGAAGKVRAIAARVYEDKEIRVQQLNNFLASPAGQDPAVIQHFSSKRLARIWEELLDLTDDNIVQEYVRIGEGLEAQQIASAAQQQLQAEGAASQEPEGPGGPQDTSEVPAGSG